MVLWLGLALIVVPGAACVAFAIHAGASIAGGVLALVLMALQPTLVQQTWRPLYPSLVHVIAAAACLSPLAFGVPASFGVALLWGTIFGIVRRPDAGTVQAVLEGSMVAVTVGVAVSPTDFQLDVSLNFSIGVSGIDLKFTGVGILDISAASGI